MDILKRGAIFWSWSARNRYFDTSARFLYIYKIRNCAIIPPQFGDDGDVDDAQSIAQFATPGNNIHIHTHTLVIDSALEYLPDYYYMQDNQ